MVPSLQGWFQNDIYEIPLKINPPKGGANALSRWGPIEGLSNLYCIGERKWGFQKHERKSTFFEPPKNFIVRMGGWVVIFWVLWFFSKSGIITSKMCWFQIWPQKLSTAIRSKVMSNLSLKMWNFKAHFRGGNRLKKMMVTKDLSSRRKLRKVFKKKIYRKKGILWSKIWKKQRVQKWKMWNFKAHFRGGNLLKKIMVTKDLS